MMLNALLNSYNAHVCNFNATIPMLMYACLSFLAHQLVKIVLSLVNAASNDTTQRVEQYE